MFALKRYYNVMNSIPNATCVIILSCMYHHLNLLYVHTNMHNCHISNLQYVHTIKNITQVTLTTIQICPPYMSLLMYVLENSQLIHP
jgi:hypothetical protein